MYTAQVPHCKACDEPLSKARSLGRKNGFEFLPCSRCGTVTVSPFPSLDELISFYQSYKGTVNYRAKREKKIARARKRISRLVKLTPGRRFLYVGCNYGFSVKAALDLGLDARGIDIDATAVAESRSAFGSSLFEVASVEEYATRGKKVDILYTSEVIEHVPDPGSFVCAIAKILETDGILYLITPDAGHWNRPRDFTTWEAVIPPEHITYFTRLGITTLLEKYGLKVVNFAFSLKPGIRVTARKY